MTRLALPLLTLALALSFLALGLRAGVRQYREDLYVQAAAREAISETTSPDIALKVAAIRDFIRGRIKSENFSSRNRPFLRDSAAESLEKGRGRCGEATRLFVNMASAVGISAHRLYLEGRKPHVVAVVKAEDGRKLVIDSTDRPYVPEIVSFESLQQDSQFTAYSTFGFRRLSILRSLPSHDVNLGPLNYVLENPHALIACLWLFPSAVLFCLSVLLNKKMSSRIREESESDLSVIAGLSEGAEI